MVRNFPRYRTAKERIEIQYQLRSRRDTAKLWSPSMLGQAPHTLSHSSVGLKSKRPVYFVVHVPKCAGRTIAAHLLRNLDSTRYRVADWRRDGFRLLRKRKHNFSYEPELAESLDVISGHRLNRSLGDFFEGRPIRETVLLRPPLDYLLSYYNFRMNRCEAVGRRLISFDVWYRTRPLNPISSFLLTYYFSFSTVRQQFMTANEKFDLLSWAFSRFWFVGAHESCDTLLDGLCRELSLPNEYGRKNVNTRKKIKPADLSSKFRQKIERDNLLDLHLFNTWKDAGFAPGSVRYRNAELERRKLATIGRTAMRPLAYGLIGLNSMS